MTDSTHVELTIRKIDEIEFRLLDEKFCGFQTGPIESESECKVQLLTFEYDDVNNTNLGLEFLLQQAGIPFDKKWGAGDEYCEGTIHIRFYSDRTAKTLQKIGTNHLIGLNELRQSHNNNSIDKLIMKYEELNDVMSWDAENNRKPYQNF